MRRFVLLPLTTAVFLFMAADATATTVTVPDDIPTLQAVMDSLNNNGVFSTVYVRPGVVTDSLYAINLGGLTVIGLGDSLTRPSIGQMTVNATATFVNVRFTGLIHTIGKATLEFRECRIEAGLTSTIDGSPRSVSLVRCRITGTVFGYSDIGIDVNACWFDRGGVVLRQDGVLNVGNSTFTGPSDDTAIAATGEVHVSIRGNTIRGFGAAIVAGSEESIVIVERNVIQNCGAGIGVSGVVQVTDNVVTDCAGNGIAVGIADASGRIERNVVGRSGGHGVYIERPAMSLIGDFAVVNNTSFDNAGSGFTFLLAEVHGQDSVTHNIGYGNGGHGVLSLGQADPRLSCNDWFANDSIAVSGMVSSPTDLLLDPLFCDVANDSVSLVANSPLLDAPGCGLIGARGMGCASTPTLVTLFTAERDAEGVRLRWQIADPTRLTDVWIERADVASGPWSRVSTEQTTDGAVIVSLDRSALAERGYWYRLVALEGAEVIVIGEPVSVLGTVTQRFELTRVTPNPGFGPLRLSFTLAREATVEMDLVDLQGRLVAALVRGPLKAGTHTVEWMGPSTPGIFFVDYRYPGGHQVERVVRLR